MPSRAVAALKLADMKPLARPYRKLLAVALFIGLLFAAFELSGLRQHFSLEFLQQQILTNKVTGLLLFVALFALRQLTNPLAIRIFRHLDRRPLLSVIALRTLFQTVPVLNYALAMSGIRFRNYLLGTLLGLPLPIALYCLLFDTLASQLVH